ncbi:MAG TPA: hypothetical protein DEV96_01665, partial [Rhodospirillum rubrum]|nr:hypothetical protein [Rhodospirillum rubrum]
MPMFQLGDPVNVLSGLGSVAGEVAPPPGPRPLIAISRAQPPSLRPFAPLAVTLHESLGGLLTALFDVRVDVSREHLGQRRLDAAALIAPDPAFLARIGAPAAGYLLFTLDRDDGEVVHDVASIGIDDRVHMADYWTEAGKRAMARLRSTATRLDADGVWRPFVRQAQMARYLDYFYHHGTHFISRIGYGQRLWQVFALRAERMAFLVDHFRRVVPGGRAEGALAASFAQFCGPEWCDRRSEILALTPEDTLPGLVAAGAFKGVGDADVLAAPFLEAEWRAARLLDGFGAGGPLRLHLMSQAYLMGEGRARVWQKVLNVALVQRYGAGTAAVSQGEPAMSPALATGAATGGLADRLRLRGGAAVAVPAGLRELWVGDIAVEPFGAPAVVCHAPEGLTLHAGEIDGIVAVEESPSRRVTYGWGLK